MFRPSPRTPQLPSNAPRTYLRRADLIARGATPRAITDAVRRGELIRARRDRYLPGDCHPIVAESVRLGGRVDCISLLALLGVFVFDASTLHVRMHPHASRVPAGAPSVVRHWVDDDAEAEHVVTPVMDALTQAVLCQSPRMAIATLDSAWHLRLVDADGIAEVFRRLPRRYRRLRGLLDPQSESGSETLLRLMLRGLGIRPELQAEIETVGFVDLLVDGWLIIECDSRAHHNDWAARLRDLRRDAAALRLGYVTLRLPAEDILYRPDAVLGLVRDVLRHHPFATGGSQLRRTGAGTGRTRASRAERPASPEL